MRIFIAAGAVLLSLLGNFPSSAADMPTKAPKPSVLQTYAGSGFYFGIGTFGEVDRTKITGPAGQAFSADIAGGALSGTVGYMWGNGTSWRAVDVSAEWFNIGGSNVQGNLVPASVNTQWGFTERFLLGGPLASVLNLLPNLSTIFPALPTPTVPVTGTIHPYIFAALHEKDISASYLLATGKVWRVQGGLGVGAKQQLGNVQGNPQASQVTVDYWAEYLIPSSGITLGPIAGGIPANANVGGGARVGMSLQY